MLLLPEFYVTLAAYVASGLPKLLRIKYRAAFLALVASRRCIAADRTGADYIAVRQESLVMLAEGDNYRIFLNVAVLVV